MSETRGRQQLWPCAGSEVRTALVRGQAWSRNEGLGSKFATETRPKGATASRSLGGLVLWAKALTGRRAGRLG